MRNHGSASVGMRHLHIWNTGCVTKCHKTNTQVETVTVKHGTHFFEFVFAPKRLAGIDYVTLISIGKHTCNLDKRWFKNTHK